MRKMKNIATGTIMNVVQHIMTRNMWEYYISDEETNDRDLKFGFVMGLEDEIGYIYLPEVYDHILSKTSNLKDVMPAKGYVWVDEEEV